MHARAGRTNVFDILHSLRRFKDGVDQDRTLDRVSGFQLGEQLIEIVDVPGTLDLRQHDDVELVSDRCDNVCDVVQNPGDC